MAGEWPRRLFGAMAAFWLLSLSIGAARADPHPDDDVSISQVTHTCRLVHRDIDQRATYDYGGLAIFQYSSSTRTLRYKIIHNESGHVFTELRRGYPGVRTAGLKVIDGYQVQLQQGSLSLSSTQATYLNNGEVFLDVSSQADVSDGAGGSLRCQLIDRWQRVVEEQVTLDDGSGGLETISFHALISFDEDALTMSYRIEHDRATDFPAGFVVSICGESGSCDDIPATSSPMSGVIDLTSEYQDRYDEVFMRFSPDHDGNDVDSTPEYSVHYYAWLSPDQVVGAHIDSEARGILIASELPDGLTLVGSVAHTVSDPERGYFHGHAYIGAAAPVLGTGVAVTDDGWLPSFSKALTSSQKAGADSSAVYVDIFSELYSVVGEVRGQLLLTHHVFCGAHPEHANSDGGVCDGQSAGNECVYTCAEGYGPDDTIVCLASGEWEPFSSDCEPITCGTLPSKSNADVACDPDGWDDYQATCTYTCAAGFEGDDDVLTCQEDGEWTALSDAACTGITCPAPDGVDNADRVCNGQAYGDTCVFTCSAGYEGSAQISSCGGAGTWGAVTLVCEPRECGEAADKEHATMTCTGEVFGDACEYTCESGYTGGDEVVACGQEGHWDAFASECVPVECGSYPGKTGTEVSCTGDDGDNLDFGTVCTYSCITGYTGEPDSITCQASGEWTALDGTLECEEVGCGAPATYPGARVTCPGGTLFGDSCAYECREGYTGSGDSVTCQADGAWSNATDVACAIVSCGPEPEKQHSSVDCEGDQYLDACEYSCDLGYTGEEEFITCESDGAWQPVLLTCDIVDCGPHAGLEETGDALEMRCDGQTYQSTCTAVCRDGWEGVDETSTCQADGSWSSFTDTCSRVSCGAPPEPESSSSTCSGTSFEDTCTFTCDAGYQFPGDDDGDDVVTSVCGADGTWSVPAATCEAKECGAPPALEGAAVTCDDEEYTFGTTCVVRCDAGRVAGEQVFECDEAGEWESITLSCPRLTCGEPDEKPNAQIVCTGLLFEDLCEYSCDEGFEGDDELVTCRSDGSWDNSTIECAVVTCDGAPFKEHATPNCEGSDYLDACLYTCDQGYTGDTEFTTCEAHGEWQPLSGTCTIVDCGENDQEVEGVTDLECSGTDYSSVCRFPCAPGWEGVAEASVCQADGEWSLFTPTCHRINCGFLPDYGHSSHACDASVGVFETTCRITCDVGYLSNGAREEDVMCMADGQWAAADSHNAFLCLPVDCGAPPTKNGALRDCGDDSTGYLARCDYACMVGYDGPEEDSFCGPDGQWSALTTPCGVVDCGNGPTKPFATTLCSGTEYGDTCVQACNPGYIGPLEVQTCQLNGDWTPLEANCEAVDCGVPPPRANSNTACADGHGYLATCTSTCEVGFLGNTETLSCSRTGQWTAFKTTCEAVVCGDYPVKHHATRSCTGHAYTDTCEFTCELGHSGPVERTTCQANGEWSTIENGCGIVDCGEPALKAHSDITCSGQTWNSQCAYTCESGYQGPFELVTCQANGAWGRLRHECTVVSCDGTPEVHHGEVVCDGMLNGDSCMLTCEQGYVGPDTVITCDLTEDGYEAEWSAYDPHMCPPVDCGAPDKGAGQVVVCEDNQTTFGTVCVYTCGAGYQSAAGEIECAANGEWTDSLHACVPMDCGEPPVKDGAKLQCTAGFSFPSVCTYECRSSHFGPSEQIACSSNGRWVSEFDDDSGGECQLKVCAQDGVWPATPNDQVAIRDCDELYNGHVYRLCEKNTQKWEDPVEQCERRPECPLNCQWRWSAWSRCEATVAGGSSSGIRYRFPIETQAADCGGTPCHFTDDSAQTETCAVSGECPRVWFGASHLSVVDRSSDAGVPGQFAGAAVDGNLISWWHAAGPHNQWVVVAFGSVEPVFTVNILRKDRRARQGSIHVASDFTFGPWVEVATFTLPNAPLPQGYDVDFPTVFARYWRVSIFDTYDEEWVGLAEVRFEGYRTNADCTIPSDGGGDDDSGSESAESEAESESESESEPDSCVSGVLAHGGIFALGASSTAPTAAGGPPQATTDGDFETWWKSDGRLNQWVLYDLTSDRPVAGVVIYKEAERVKSGTVQRTSSPSSTVFTTMGNFVSPAGETVVEVTFKTTEARYVRIYVTEAHGDHAYIGWREIEFILDC